MLKKYSMRSILLFCGLIILCIASVFLSGCDDNGVSGEEFEQKYIFANIPYYKNGLEVFCRVNVDTGKAFPICDDPLCDHTACACSYVTIYDISPDKKTVGFIDFCSNEKGESCEQVMMYSVETGKLERVILKEFNSFHQLLVFNDRMIYSNTTVIKQSGDYAEEYIRGYYSYSYKDGSIKLLKEIKNGGMQLLKSGNRIVEIITTETDKGFEQEHVVYDLDLNEQFRTKDYSKAFTDYKDYFTIPVIPGGEYYFISDNGIRVPMYNEIEPIAELNDYKVYSEKAVWTEETTEDGRRIIPPEAITVWAIGKAYGEIKQLFCGVGEDIAKKYGMQEIVSLKHINYTMDGGPKAGNKLLFIVSGYMPDVDEFGFEYDRGVEKAIIIDAETGEVIDVTT